MRKPPRHARVGKIHAKSARVGHANAVTFHAAAPEVPTTDVDANAAAVAAAIVIALIASGLEDIREDDLSALVKPCLFSVTNFSSWLPVQSYCTDLWRRAKGRRGRGGEAPTMEVNDK
jgi:hypothetical protein